MMVQLARAARATPPGESITSAATDERARLLDVQIPDAPVGGVLVLHGGGSRQGSVMVSPTQLSVLRMVPIARAIARASRQLSVFRLLNSSRGWDASWTPVADARWALDQVEARFDRPLPMCVVGHSLGGRAAILASDHASVRSVVALAPWVYPSDTPVRPHAERFLIVHGDQDRIADPARSADLADRLGQASRTGYVTVRRGRHAMVRRHRVFSSLAAEFAAATLTGHSTNRIVARLLAGESRITV